MGVARIREWSLATGELSDDDIFISGDVDEVMSRSALHQLRWCKTSSNVMSGSLWMPQGNLNKALRLTNHHGKHGFSMPTIYTWKTVKSKSFAGRRLFLKDFVSGGIHLTASAFIPNAILKEFTATEDDFYNGFINLEYLFNMNMVDMAVEQERLYTQYYRQAWADSWDPVENVDDVELYLPWFMDCNRERFPYWFGREDPRNKKLLDRLAELKNTFHFPHKEKKVSHLFSKFFYRDPKNSSLILSKPISD